jgi:glucose-6-phosphate isomerase
MLFFDTNNDAALRRFETFAKKEINSEKEVLLISISKSGGTAETIANTEIILGMLQSRFKKILEQLVVITNEGSNYWNAANEKGIDTLSIPEMVGGRYSIFSAVGLFPLAAMGYNIDSLLGGAKKMRATCLSTSIKKNPALASASILFLQNKKGKTINDNFIFHSELESVGKWYRQLMGESVGKEKNRKNKKVNAGITPTVSIGSTDLHSVGQLYLGGPKDKITTFIYSADEGKRVGLPKKRLFPNLVTNVTGKSAQDILRAILEGVKVAYTKKKLPYIEVVLDDISLTSIGSFFQFKMLEMMYLAELMDVNAFDQPNVENYKVETKKILNK